MSKIPSICIIPSAYKANKVYSVLPTDGSGDLNFARASEATRVNQNGLIETVDSNVPRIDYTDGGCPILLLEPQSTNLITHSEDFTNASWVKTNSTVTLSTENALGKDAYVLEDDVANDYHLLTYDTLLSSGTHTRSFYVKKVNCRYVYFAVSSTPTSIVNTWVFDLDNNEFTQNGSAGIGQDFEALSNGWVRISFTNITSASGNRRITVGLSNVPTGSGASFQYVGTGNKVLVSMAQYEPLEYATSYMPSLLGVSGTRVAETLSKSGLSNYINSSEGVLYAEMSALSDLADLGSRAVSISDGTGNNRLYIFLDNNANRISYQFVANGVLQSSGNNNITDVSDFFKIAISYKTDQLLIYVNGTEFLSEVTSLIVPNSNTFNRIGFDSGSGFSDFYGKVKDLRVYNQALTDTQLQNLTS